MKDDIDAESAEEAMTEFVRGRFSPLANFASIDGEAPNGFAFPSVDIREQLAENFPDYPETLVEEVAAKLEDEGPWGDEKRYFEP